MNKVLSALFVAAIATVVFYLLVVLILHLTHKRRAKQHKAEHIDEIGQEITRIAAPVGIFGVLYKIFKDVVDTEQGEPADERAHSVADVVDTEQGEPAGERVHSVADVVDTEQGEPAGERVHSVVDVVDTEQGEPADERAHSVADEEQPVPISLPLPSFTNEAIRARREGTVLIRGIVRKNGCVDSLEVLEGLGYGLDEAAIDVIGSKWRFKPATKHGKPIDVYVNIEVTFRLP